MSDRQGMVGVYRMNAVDGSDVRFLAGGYDLDRTRPDWSRDGSAIVFSAVQNGNADIFVMDGDGHGTTAAPDRLTTDAGSDFQASWSPNRQRVAFVSDRNGGDSEIYVINADGSGEARLTQNPGRDERPAWSPDGARIAFVRSPGGNDEIYVMNADGSSQAQVGDLEGNEPSWAPDSATIVFTGQDQGRSEIYFVNPDGSNKRSYWLSGPTNEIEAVFG